MATFTSTAHYYRAEDGSELLTHFTVDYNFSGSVEPLAILMEKFDRSLRLIRQLPRQEPVKLPDDLIYTKRYSGGIRRELLNSLLKQRETSRELKAYANI